MLAAMVASPVRLIAMKPLAAAGTASRRTSELVVKGTP
jgi:hypothetical protein